MKKSIQTIPFHQILHKVHMEDFSTLEDPYPNILGGQSLSKLILALKIAKQKQKPIVWALGAHATKTGLDPLILWMNRNGYATHIIMNGATAIHSTEIALFGETSEWVEDGLQAGKFGFSDETGLFFRDCVVYNKGGLADRLRKSLHSHWTNIKCEDSLIYGFDGPVLCFSAQGTETVYQHPMIINNDFYWEQIGLCSKYDFNQLVKFIPNLDDGGVYINCCSSVVLPEIFMKAFSVCSNLGVAPKSKNWTAVVLDKIRQYRATQNVLERPGANKIELLGEVEITIPTIYRELAKV